MATARLSATKRDGAWMQGLVTGVWSGGAKGAHAEVLAGNLTPPIGDRPAPHIASAA